MSRVEATPAHLLDDYIPLTEAAEQPNMPTLRTLQRWAAERRLDGLIYVGRKPFVHMPTFRQSLQARVQKAVTGRARRR